MTATGEVSWELVLEAMWHIVAVVMQAKDWTQSFLSVGIANEQRNISERTKRNLQIEPTAMAVGRGLPTLTDLTYIFQRVR